MEDSFEQVAKRYEPMIKNTMKQLRMYKGVEEAYQIGLIALWEAYEKFDPAKGDFSAYAKATVKGRMLTALTKAKTYDDRHVFPKPQEDGGDWFHAIAGAPGTLPLEHETVQLYVHGLSKRQRLWVEEALLFGKKTRDIAAEQGVSQNTVRTWKKEALKKMRLNAQQLA